MSMSMLYNNESERATVQHMCMHMIHDVHAHMSTSTPMSSPVLTYPILLVGLQQ